MAKKALAGSWMIPWSKTRKSNKKIACAQMGKKVDCCRYAN